MPLGVATEFNDEEAAQLEALRDPTEPPLDASDEGPTGQTASDDTGNEGAANNQPPGGQAQQPTDDAGKTPQQATDKPQGDLRQALRASRRAEQRAKDELQRVREENEALRKQAPQQKPPATEEITDDELEELAMDFPAMAKVAKAVKQMAAKEAPAAPTPSANDFVPPTLPPELQEVVDDFPDLLTWQNDPDQSRFEMAQAADALLLRIPKWKAASEAERLAEVVRRVNQELGQQPAARTPAGIDPAKAIENAPMRQARSMGDFGGGGGRDALGNDLARFSSMSADDVEAELMTRG